MSNHACDFVSGTGFTVLNKQMASRRLDWIVFALRWLLIASALIALASGRDAVIGGETSSQVMVFAIIAAVIYNLLFAVLLLLDLSGDALKLVTMIGDVGLAAVFFWASSGSPLIMVGMGLFAVIIATLRYGRTSGLLVTGLIGVLCLAVQVVMGQLSNHGPALLIGILFLFLTAALTSLVSGSAPVQDDDPTIVARGIESHRLRAARDRARAIYEMASTLGATLDYNKVLESALDVGVLGLREMGPGARLIGMVLLFQHDELRVATARGLTRQDQRLTTPGRRGVLGLALKQAEPVFASNTEEDPELKYFAAFQDAKSILAIPLRAGFDNYGVLVYGSTEPNAFSDEHIELLTAIGTQATIALQNAVLYQNLVTEKERIVEVEEEARKKLARDLHDGPTQSIAAIAMRVNYIRRLIQTKPESADEELQKVEELARKTTKEIRHMLFTLRPLVLETQGLSAALKQFAEKMKETHDLSVTLQAQQDIDQVIEPHRQGVLFYIVEEAVGNARKHAQANNIYVRLYRRDKYAVVEIQDDGVGFDVDAVTSNYEKRGSLGMVNMRERVALIEGTLQIDSAKGQGTKISVFVPIKEPANTLPSEDFSRQAVQHAVQRAAQVPTNPNGK
jgi:signal transduction histidine kinase